MVALAQANVPQASFAVMDSRDIGKLPQQFDGIVCGFLFPYLSPTEIDYFLAIAADKLQAGGALYLSTMEADAKHQSGWQRNSAGDEMYMYYHSEPGLTTLLKKNGFDAVDTSRKTIETPDDGAVDLIIIAKLPAASL